MSLSVASNVYSLRVQTELRRTSTALGTAYERLSSGLRINDASDDPAGLALADILKSQGKNLAVASRNTNDGLSLTSVADAALGEIVQLLSRMAELANQSSNGVYTNTQRSAISSEFLALGSEIDRISQVTTFNGLTLLSNSSAITIQVGIDGTANSRVTIDAVLGTLSSLGIGTTGGALSYSVISSTADLSVTASRLAFSAVSSALETATSRRGLVGAATSRLSYTIDYLSVTRENTLAAESNIRDADVAQEIANLVRLQVLQQAQTAVLAQANQQPAVALKLLS